MQRGRPHTEVKAPCKHSKVLHRKTPESTPQRKAGRRLRRTRHTCRSCVMVRPRWCQEPGNPDYAQHHVVKTSSSRNQLAPQHTSTGRQLCVAPQMISPGSAFSPALGKLPIILGSVSNHWQQQVIDIVMRRLVACHCVAHHADICLARLLRIFHVLAETRSGSSQGIAARLAPPEPARRASQRQRRFQNQL